MLKRPEILCPVCDNTGSDPITIGKKGVLNEQDFREKRSFCAKCSHQWNPCPKSCDYGDDDFLFLPGEGDDRLTSQFEFFDDSVPVFQNVLEVGCSNGDFASFLKTKWDINQYHGIEISEAAVDAKVLLDKVFQVPLCDPKAISLLNDTKYDFVIYSHTLEHISDVVRELNRVYELMSVDGRLFIEVPNVSGTLGLPFDFNPAHIQFFSPTSLCTLLNSIGFDVVKMATHCSLHGFKNDCIRVVARKKADYSAEYGDLLWNSIRHLLGEKQFILWGTSGLADKLVRQYVDGSHIKLCVDTYKHGQTDTFMGMQICEPAVIRQYPDIPILISSVDFEGEIRTQIDDLSKKRSGRVAGIAEVLSKLGRKS